MEGCGISRDEAVAMLERKISNIALRRNCLATGAIMRSLASRLGCEDCSSACEVTGILHDLDYEETASTPERHGTVTCAMLEGRLPAECLHAILSHNAENNGSTRETRLDRLLTAAECVTGLVTATALIHPDRRIAGVEPSSVIKRMNKTGFARTVSREGIMECVAAGIDLDEFVAISLDSMKSMAEDLGL